MRERPQQAGAADRWLSICQVPELCEKIQDVAVVGVPNKKYGEEVCAFIKIREGMETNEEEIKNYCKDGISRFKIPKYILFTEDFPMTASGKIRKIDLREIAKDRLKL